MDAMTPSFDDLEAFLTALLNALDDVTRDVEKYGLYDPKHHDAPWWPDSAKEARDLLIRIEKGYDQ